MKQPALQAPLIITWGTEVIGDGTGTAAPSPLPQRLSYFNQVKGRKKTMAISVSGASAKHVSLLGGE